MRHILLKVLNFVMTKKEGICHHCFSANIGRKLVIYSKTQKILFLKLIFEKWTNNRFGVARARLNPPPPKFVKNGLK
jgi:hypothetical protein